MTTPDPAVTPTPEPEATKTTIETKPVSPPAEPEDPIQKLQSDPNALSQLLSQVQALTNELNKTATERDSFKTKEEQARRAQQTKEEQLQVDLDKANANIERLHNVLKTKIVENAISGAKNYEWHSVKQVMAELNPEAFDVDIDMDKAEGTVSGIDSEIKRIAQQCPWLVSKDRSKPADDGRPRPTRPSGSPVAPPSGDAAKLTKREALIKKYPVIVQGR